MVAKFSKSFSTSSIKTSVLKINRILRLLKNFTYKEVFIILKYLSYPISILIFKIVKSLIFTLYIRNKVKIINLILNSKKLFNTSVNKGLTFKKIDIRSRGYTGIRKKKTSNIIINL